MFIYPKITIITPSYNQGKYIEECILSVLNQNYPNLEYIIIDGGSTDNTLDIIQKYEHKLTYWVSEPDTGQSDAVNKGLRKATGEIINWLNADDYYESQALWRIVREFENSEIKVVCGRCQVFKDTKETIQTHCTNGTDIYWGNLAKTIGWARTDQPATFYCKEAIQKIGLLDEELHYLMDRDWWIKYLFYFGLNQVVKITDVLVNFRLHEESKTVAHIKQFQVDRDSYYASLAQKYSFVRHEKFIRDNTIVRSEYQVKNMCIEKKDLIEPVLNYYILLRANELYATNQNKEAQKYLNFVDRKLLKQEDQRLWRKLNLRNKYVPQILIRILRGIKMWISKVITT